MKHGKTRNKKHATVPYDIPRWLAVSLQNCTVRDDPDALSVVYCELQAPVGPRASLSGMIAFVDAKAGFHLNRATVCVSQV